MSKKEPREPIDEIIIKEKMVFLLEGQSDNVMFHRHLAQFMPDALREELQGWELAGLDTDATCWQYDETTNLTFIELNIELSLLAFEKDYRRKKTMINIVREILKSYRFRDDDGIF